MIKLTHMMSKVGMAALLAATMMPASAIAGEQTRAEAAIAEAKGKIDAGDRVGAGEQAPELQQRARAALVSAQDLLNQHRKNDAFTEAHQASDLADQAMASANSRKANAERDRRDNLRDAAANARQSAATANVRASDAEQATAMANMRANSAEQSSAAANAQADALRNMPHPAPAPTVTTVAVTEHDTMHDTMHNNMHQAKAPVHHKRHRVVRHSAHVKTTTTVITTNHQ
jgi:hypothetical protein